MKIDFNDDYDVTLYTVNSNSIPRLNDSVVIGGESYSVKDIIWVIERDEVIVSLTQNIVKSKPQSGDSGRLTEMSNAIMRMNGRQDTADKKARTLNEQISSIRKHINTTIQKENKKS